MEMDSSEVQVSLTKAASDYSPPVTVLGTLNAFKDAILTLRAKSASYETIMELLNQHGIKISVSSVRRFCRANQTQIKRIRTGFTLHRQDQAAVLPAFNDEKTSATQSNTPPRPVRTLRGPV